MRVVCKPLFATLFKDLNILKHKLIERIIFVDQIKIEHVQFFPPVVVVRKHFR